LFTLQNEITSRIASALNLELTAIEAVRPTEHLDTLDYILRGRAALWKPPTRESYAEAIILFECAVALQPKSVEAQSWLASALAHARWDNRRGRCRHCARRGVGRASIGDIVTQPSCAFR
jgi:hypothetical protein